MYITKFHVGKHSQNTVLKSYPFAVIVSKHKLLITIHSVVMISLIKNLNEKKGKSTETKHPVHAAADEERLNFDI